MRAVVPLSIFLLAAATVCRGRGEGDRPSGTTQLRFRFSVPVSEDAAGECKLLGLSVGAGIAFEGRVFVAEEEGRPVDHFSPFEPSLPFILYSNHSTPGSTDALPQVASTYGFVSLESDGVPAFQVRTHPPLPETIFDGLRSSSAFTGQHGPAISLLPDHLIASASWSSAAAKLPQGESAEGTFVRCARGTKAEEAAVCAHLPPRKLERWLLARAMLSLPQTPQFPTFFQPKGLLLVGALLDRVFLPSSTARPLVFYQREKIDGGDLGLKLSPLKKQQWLPPRSIRLKKIADPRVSSVNALGWKAALPLLAAVRDTVDPPGSWLRSLLATQVDCKDDEETAEERPERTEEEEEGEEETPNFLPVALLESSSVSDADSTVALLSISGKAAERHQRGKRGKGSSGSSVEEFSSGAVLQPMPAPSAVSGGAVDKASEPRSGTGRHNGVEIGPGPGGLLPPVSSVRRPTRAEMPPSRLRISHKDAAPPPAFGQSSGGFSGKDERAASGTETDDPLTALAKKAGIDKDTLLRSALLSKGLEGAMKVLGPLAKDRAQLQGLLSKMSSTTPSLSSKASGFNLTAWLQSKSAANSAAASKAASDEARRKSDEKQNAEEAKQRDAAKASQSRASSAAANAAAAASSASSALSSIMKNAAKAKLPPMPSLPKGKDPMGEVKDVLEAIMSIIRPILQGIMQPLLDPIMSFIAEATGEAIQATLMGGQPSSLTATMQALKDAALNAAMAAQQAAMAAAQSALESAQAKAQAQLEAFSSQAAAKAATALEQAKAAAAKGMAEAQSLADKAAAAAESAATSASAKMNEVAQSATTKMDEAAQSATAKMDEAAQSAAAKMDEAAQSAAAKMDAASQAANDKLNGAANSLNDKLKGAANSLNDKLKGAANSLNDKLQGAADALNVKLYASPSPEEDLFSSSGLDKKLKSGQSVAGEAPDAAANQQGAGAVTPSKGKPMGSSPEDHAMEDRGREGQAGIDGAAAPLGDAGAALLPDSPGRNSENSAMDQLEPISRQRAWLLSAAAGDEQAVARMQATLERASKAGALSLEQERLLEAARKARRGGNGRGARSGLSEVLRGMTDEQVRKMVRAARLEASRAAGVDVGLGPQSAREDSSGLTRDGHIVAAEGNGDGGGYSSWGASDLLPAADAASVAAAAAQASFGAPSSAPAFSSFLQMESGGGSETTQQAVLDALFAASTSSSGFSLLTDALRTHISSRRRTRKEQRQEREEAEEDEVGSERQSLLQFLELGSSSGGDDKKGKKPKPLLYADSTDGKQTGKPGPGGAGGAVSDGVTKDMNTQFAQLLVRNLVPALTVKGTSSIGGASIAAVFDYLSPILARRVSQRVGKETSAKLAATFRYQMLDVAPAALSYAVLAEQSGSAGSAAKPSLPPFPIGPHSGLPLKVVQPSKGDKDDSYAFTSATSESHFLSFSSHSLASSITAALTHTLTADPASLYYSAFCAATFKPPPSKGESEAGSNLYCQYAKQHEAQVARERETALSYSAYFGRYYASAALDDLWYRRERVKAERDWNRLGDIQRPTAIRLPDNGGSSLKGNEALQRDAADDLLLGA